MAATASRPTLLIIGGAEDRRGRSAILRRFVRLAGGKRAAIAIIPTASSVPDEVSDAYAAAFGRIGVRGCAVVDPRDRSEAGDDALVAHLDEATGVFMSGGSQLRLSQIFAGTPAGEAIHRAYRRGAVIGGTSAGASIMSEFMIALGEEGVTPIQRTSQLSHGFGLLPGVVIDQHFAQRQRYGRLMSVIAMSPNLIGIGIDEDTALEVVDGVTATVLGSGGVHILDCRGAITDAPDARTGAPLLVSNAVVHALPAGATFDLTKLVLVDFVEKNLDLGISRAGARA